MCLNGRTIPVIYLFKPCVFAVVRLNANFSYKRQFIGGGLKQFKMVVYIMQKMCVDAIDEKND